MPTCLQVSCVDLQGVNDGVGCRGVGARAAEIQCGSRTARLDISLFSVCIQRRFPIKFLENFCPQENQSILHPSLLSYLRHFSLVLRCPQARSSIAMNLLLVNILKHKSLIDISSQAQ